MSKYISLKKIKDKKSRAEYVRKALIEEGLKPLQDYEGNSLPILVEITEGQYAGYKAIVTWNNFIRGKRPDFRSLVDKEKFLKDKFGAEGYSIVSIPSNVKVTDKISLVSPKGYEWAVSYDSFRQGRRCPLDSDRSWGERCVSTILKENGIPFKPQKTIFHEDGSRQYMDFYVEYNGLKFDIEYNGRQHYYEEKHNRLFSSLAEQRAKDEKKKKRYCESNGIIQIEIPYTIHKVEDIAAELSKFFPVEIKSYKVESYRYDEKEIVKYFKTHTRSETAEHFGISEFTVYKIAKRNNFTKAGRVYSDEEILKYYKDHTREETAAHFNITKHIVSNIVKKHKAAKRTRYNHKEIIDFYMEHSLKETTAKFGITRQGITKIMKKHGIKKERRR